MFKNATFVFVLHSRCVTWNRKYHVSTDVTPGIRKMYSSYCFAAENNIMIPEVLTALRTGDDDTECSGM